MTCTSRPALCRAVARAPREHSAVRRKKLLSITSVVCGLLADGVEARVMWVGDQKLMVAIKRATSTRPPLLLFNGIGANWELAEPFLDALTDTTAIIFDLPGVGGSPLSALPYRPSSIARLSAIRLDDAPHQVAHVVSASSQTPIFRSLKSLFAPIRY